MPQGSPRVQGISSEDIKKNLDTQMAQRWERQEGTKIFIFPWEPGYNLETNMRLHTELIKAIRGAIGRGPAAPPIALGHSANAEPVGHYN
ncbi:hypothetical protein ONZ45_g13943 [Pleurotus djamor]|nr:hypothetical protein ONZ45_g13943 [Pleurotus djamor]